MNEVLNFVNEKTKVLLIIRENQLEIEGKNICPLNQQEMAVLVPCGKLKVNQIIKELIEEGYHYGDIVILLRSGAGRMEPMAEFLEKNGIPVS